MKNGKNKPERKSRTFGRAEDRRKSRTDDRKSRPDERKSRPDDRKSRPDDRKSRTDDRRPRPDDKEGRQRPAFGTKRLAFGAKRPPSRSPKPKTETPREDVRQGRDTVLIWGLHAARAAWLNPARKIHRAWLSEAGRNLFEATQNEARDDLLKRPDAKQMERAELDRITPPGSVHQGIIIEASPLQERSLNDIIGANPPPDLILVLDQVTDPHNVGAILRSAAAFGAGAIVMTERNAPTTTGVLAKSASGALEHTPMVHVVNLARALDELRESGYWCVGLAEEGEKNLADLDLSGRTALVLGNEGEGLRHLTRQKCDELARLPTSGPIGSLNVSNAAAVALYEVRKQKGV